MNNSNKKTATILNLFLDIYFESLVISLRAFLPSFKVLKTSQEKKETMKTSSVSSDIRLVSILLNI